MIAVYTAWPGEVLLRDRVPCAAMGDGTLSSLLCRSQPRSLLFLTSSSCEGRSSRDYKKNIPMVNYVCARGYSEVGNSTVVNRAAAAYLIFNLRLSRSVSVAAEACSEESEVVPAR